MSGKSVSQAISSSQSLGNEGNIYILLHTFRFCLRSSEFCFYNKHALPLEMFKSQYVVFFLSVNQKTEQIILPCHVGPNSLSKYTSDTNNVGPHLTVF